MAGLTHLGGFAVPLIVDPERSRDVCFPFNSCRAASPLKSDWLRTMLILSCALRSHVGLLVAATVACTVSCTAALADPTTETHTNRLIHSASPYLLQHAHNPVDWYPWGEEAFAKAKKEGKLVFLSIGYSSCHWCHVMERESFENEEVAAILNKHFVCIKVDRE